MKHLQLIHNSLIASLSISFLRIKTSKSFIQISHKNGHIYIRHLAIDILNAQVSNELLSEVKSRSYRYIQMDTSLVIIDFFLLSLVPYQLNQSQWKTAGAFANDVSKAREKRITNNMD